MHDKPAPQSANLITFDAFDSSGPKNAANLFLVIGVICVYERDTVACRNRSLMNANSARSRAISASQQNRDCDSGVSHLGHATPPRDCYRSSLSTRFSMITFQRLRKFLLLRIWRCVMVVCARVHVVRSQHEPTVLCPTRVHSFESRLELS